jgi:hypothetical protein
LEHLRTLKLVNVMWGLVVALCAGLFGLGFLAFGIHMLSKGERGWPCIGYGVATLAILGPLAALHFYAGWMVTAGRARAVQTMLAMLHLGNFPLGTAYAAYALFVCHVNPETKWIFDRPFGRRVS